MDSLTQLVLGASMGEAVCGKKLGNKALLLGAVTGTIPDLDVLASPFLDTVGELTFHRSFSHSIFFAPVGGWFFALLFWKLFQWKSISRMDLFKLFFWGFLTHILLDTCTTWGTQLLWPFSTYGFALYNVFVVDPFYTLPFLGLLIATLFFKRENHLRGVLNWIALALSTSYLILGLWFQSIANGVFVSNLDQKGIELEDMITKTTPFNIFLWTCSVKTTEGYYTGFYSLFDSDKEIIFQFEPHQHELLKSYVNEPKMVRLINVTKGYYTVENNGDTLLINDLRFGKFNGWQGKEKGEYVFKYQVYRSPSGSLVIDQVSYRKPISAAYMKSFYNRIIGEKTL